MARSKQKDDEASVRILLDMSRMGTGGSLQTSLTVLENAALDEEHEWFAVLSPIVEREFPEEREGRIKSVFRVKGWEAGLSGMIRSRNEMPEIEKRVAPDAVYTPFAPVFWKARAPHVLGFAWAYLLYPDSPFVAELLSWSRGLDALKLRAKFRQMKRDIHRFEHLMVETETVAARLRSICNVDGSIHVVRNSYSPVFDAACRDLDVGPPEDRWSILIPADYRPHKNLEMAPAVAERLAGRLDRPVEIRLTCTVESAWNRIREDAAKRGVLDSIRNLGAVPHAEYARAYAEAHVAFLPTVLECSTAAYPESFMAHTPLITSDLDFARELCGDGALYFEPGSADAAADAIERVLADAQLRADLQRRGAETLKANYPSPEERWRDIVACLERVAGAR